MCQAQGRTDRRTARDPRQDPFFARQAAGHLQGFVIGDAFDAVGGFPEQPLMEDIEMSRRLRRLTAPACLRQRVTTSGRRWETRGIWRTIVLMWRLRLLYAIGVAPERLARSYR